MVSEEVSCPDITIIPNVSECVLFECAAFYVCFSLFRHSKNEEAKHRMGEIPHLMLYSKVIYTELYCNLEMFIVIKF